MSEDQEYNRAVVLYNPTKESTPRFTTAREQVNVLTQSLGIPLETVASDRDTRTTQERVLKIVTSSDLLLVLGGDGTINPAVQALVRQDKEKRLTLLAVPVGTANDFSRNHNGSVRGPDGLVTILRSGKLIDIHPMSLSVASEAEDRPHDYIAINNAGIGYTALMAELLDSSWHRDSALRKMPIIGQVAQEIRAGNRSMSNLKLMPIYENGNDEPTYVLDRSFVHAQTAGKYGRYRISHLDPEFLDIPSYEATRRGIIGGAVATMIGRYNGQRATQVKFSTGEQEALGHVDGETFVVAPSSQVTVGLAPESFKTYSRKLCT